MIQFYFLVFFTKYFHTMKFRRISIIIVLFSLSAIQLNGQQKNIAVNLNWSKPNSEFITEDHPVTFLFFDGAVYDEKFSCLPLWITNIPLQDEYELRVALSNIRTTFCNAEELKGLCDLGSISNEFVIQSQVVSSMHDRFQQIIILPFRMQGNSIEKLVSFEINFSKEIQVVQNQQKSRRIYATHSVLATGDWYKFKTTSTGIYKISYSDLLKMGIPVTSIDPKNIRIYGNGGAMLPEANAAERWDDLQENSIFVSGESDGKFDQNDYILFYATAPNSWVYDSVAGRFYHRIHSYSNFSCYFLTTSLGPGKRIQNAAPVTSPADYLINKYNDRFFHEKDSLNLIKSGRNWYGEVFDIQTVYNYSFNFPTLTAGSRVFARFSAAGRSSSLSTFTYNVNGNQMVTTIPSLSLYFTDDFAREVTDTFSFIANSTTLSVSISYNKPTLSAIGWLNFLEFNLTRDLKMSSGQLQFRSVYGKGPGKVCEYKVQNASNQTKIWDVTQPLTPTLIDAVVSGNECIFKATSDVLREFVAHNGTSYYTIAFIEKVTNQDLHGTGQPDMVIVGPHDFISEANRLAQLHKNQDGMDVLVVEPKQIYNEFSSGQTDATAIRDFMKMLYDRAGSNASLLPRYLLLFGDGSYDNKNRIPNNSNLIPTWQSEISLHPAYSYVSDDYYGLLDDNEGSGANGHLDIGIGRLPVKNITQAKEAVNKIYRYYQDASNPTGLTIPRLGDWRNTICFIADDEDSNLHLIQAEALASYVDTAFRTLNIDKIYFDAFPQVSTPTGQRYPEVNTAINNRVAKGALLINYTGHGGETGWSHERVLEVSDIQSWGNYSNMPAFVTATCEFSRFDDPERTSAGEWVFLNSNGGGICLFTTTRLSFSSTNYTLNLNFLQNTFKKINGEYPRMGDIIRKAKVASGSLSYNRNFVLLGDPALKLCIPEFGAEITHFNTHPVDNISSPDTLKALQKVTIKGKITDGTGSVKTDFNGIVYPSVYDKSIQNSTLANDPYSYPYNFTLQKNLLYKGKASVNQGIFQFSFVVPKDIAYNYGKGKISIYASNQQTDATGFFENFIIGGSASNVAADNQGPEIELFLNDKKFVFGGITDQNPLLLVYVSDSNGINTIGNGIGHDAVAILDNNTQKSIVLNDYYEAALDDYTRGVIRYPFKKISEGSHSLKVKLWDVYNNSSDSYLDFIVASSSEIALRHVLNYPNPFSTHTSFMFEHNQAATPLNVKIDIFTITGKKVKTLETQLTTEGNLVYPEEITWDGRDEFGDVMGRGVYLYKLRVSTQNGSSTEKIEKLVILR